MRSSVGKLSLSIIWLSVLMELVVGAVQNDYVKNCSSPSDCPLGHCCRLGMERFGQPYCQKLGTVGDTCMMGAEPEDKILTYPNGKTHEVFGVYRLFCPCEGSLSCHQATCTLDEPHAVVRKKSYNIDDFDYKTLDTPVKNDNFAEFDN